MELGVCSRDRELLGHWSGLSVEWCVSRVRRRQLGGITASPHLWLPASRKMAEQLSQRGRSAGMAREKKLEDFTGGEQQ